MDDGQWVIEQFPRAKHEPANGDETVGKRLEEENEDRARDAILGKS